MCNDINNNEDFKISKEQLLYLETRVKKLMDNGNYELAAIMAQNISKCIDNNYNSKVKMLKHNRKIIKIS